MASSDWRALAPDEQEIRDVDAADEQHERDAALQQQQRRPYRLDALLLDAADVHRHAGALRESFQAVGSRVDVALLQGLGLGVRLARRDAGLEASEQLDAHTVTALRILCGRGPAQRHDELHPRIERFQHPRRDADDLVGFIVDPHFPAEDLRTLLVLRLPVRLRQHDDLVGALPVLLLGEEAAEHGLDPQDAEDFGGRPDARDADDGILVSDQAVKERPQRRGSRRRSRSASSQGRTGRWPACGSGRPSPPTSTARQSAPAPDTAAASTSANRPWRRSPSSRRCRAPG